MDSRWTFDKCQQSGVGTVVAKCLDNNANAISILGSLVSATLTTLETLDRHKFEISNEAGNMDKLCNEVFRAEGKDPQEVKIFVFIDKLSVSFLGH